jgi:hypothetical protein
LTTRFFILLFLFVLVVPLTGCGSSDDSGAGELARQQELAAARRQAAEDAQQSAHIEELERKLKGVKRGSSQDQSPTTAAAPPSSSTATTPSLGDWPGGAGYTVILASVSSEAEARSTQQEASGRGLDAGLLYSSNFNSLRPGYWVVFSGFFSTEQETVARTSRAQELGYSDAYARFVAP